MTEMHPISAEALNRNLRHEAYAQRSKAFAITSSALGVFIIMVSIALWICALALRQATPLANDGREVADAIVRAIETTKIRTTVSGQVNLNPTPLTLDPSSAVRLADRSFVQLDPASSVRISSNIKIVPPRPSESQLRLSDTAANGESPITEYTIFRTIPVDKGDVETGWRYDIANPSRPRIQHCKYRQSLSPGKELSFIIAIDGVKQQGEAAVKLGLNLESLYAYCHWA